MAADQTIKSLGWIRNGAVAGGGGDFCVDRDTRNREYRGDDGAGAADGDYFAATELRRNVNDDDGVRSGIGTTTFVLY